MNKLLILILILVAFMKINAMDEDDLKNLKIFFGDRGQDKIVRANLDGSNIVTTVEEDVGSIYNLVIEDNGNNRPKLFWSDQKSGEIKAKSLPNSIFTGNIDVVATGLISPKSIRYANIDGDKDTYIYYAEAGPGGVLGRVRTDDSTPESVISPSTGYFVTAIEVNVEANAIWYVQQKTFQDCSINRINLDGSNRVILVNEEGNVSDSTATESVLWNPRDLHFDSETNRIYYMDRHEIRYISATSTSTPTSLISGINTAFYQMTRVPGNTTVYWSEGLEEKSIFYADLQNLETTKTKLLDTGLGSNPAGIAFASFSGVSSIVASASLTILITLASLVFNFQ